MIKTIKKCYCDICEKEDPRCMRYQIPDYNYKITSDVINPEIKKENKILRPTECDICPKCAELLYLNLTTMKKIVNAR